MRRPPVSLLSALALGLLISSCTPDPTPDTLANKSLSMGQQLTLDVSQDFAGTWSLKSKPAWLQVNPQGGKGKVSFTVTADRAKATPVEADQASLSGAIELKWTGGTASSPQSGTATWTVAADQFKLTGRVLEGAAVQGLDVSAQRQQVANVDAEPRGVIVKYHANVNAVSSAGLTTQAGRRASVRGEAALTAAGVKVQSRRDLSGQTASLAVSDVPAALRALRADPNVEYAVPNAILRTQQVQAQQVQLAQPVLPTDQYAGLQWPFRLLGYPAVWRDMESGAYVNPVTVAVVDSGVRYDHPDLAGQMWLPSEGALDLLPQYVDTKLTIGNGDGDGVDTDPTDPTVAGRQTESHGTHVTGIIVARWGENAASCAGCSATGVVGATYKANVKVLPIRVIATNGYATEADAALAVRYAAGLPITVEGQVLTNPHPAKVINLSLGGEMSATDAQPMCEEIQNARNAGALVFAASGNSNTTTPFYPANCPAAVAVGSVTLSGGSAPKRALYSNYYPAVQLSAPGGSGIYVDYTTYNGATLNDKPFPDEVFSTGWNFEKNEPEYVGMAGTSQATPQVAALAALMLSKGVTTDAESTLARLTATATDLGAAGRDDMFGYGMINPVSALGAPAISDTFGLRLQNERGMSFQPAVDALGRFQAYLGDGTYGVTAGRDQNGNGVYGESNEPHQTKFATIGPEATSVDVGDLQPQ